MPHLPRNTTPPPCHHLAQGYPHDENWQHLAAWHASCPQQGLQVEQLYGRWDTRLFRLYYDVVEQTVARKLIP